MPIDPTALLELIEKCSPDVHPQTMFAIVQTESKGNQFAININGGQQLAHQPTTEAEAIKIAKDLIIKKVNFDAGLAQINSKNFDWLGLTPEIVFESCKNLQSGSKVLIENYILVSQKEKAEKTKLDGALSMYNTGNTTRGLKNGYVDKVKNNSKQYIVPAISDTLQQQEQTIEAKTGTSWNVFDKNIDDSFMVFK